ELVIQPFLLFEKQRLQNHHQIDQLVGLGFVGVGLAIVTERNLETWELLQPWDNGSPLLIKNSKCGPIVQITNISSTSAGSLIETGPESCMKILELQLDLDQFATGGKFDQDPHGAPSKMIRFVQTQ